MVIHGRCFIQSQCKKFIDNTTNEKNGTSDGYSFGLNDYSAGKSGSGHNLKGDLPQGDIRYDAAAANMRSPWKMFTRAQVQELIDKTTYQWTTINGVNGGKFTNKSDSTKYIFLPAAGMWGDSLGNAGSYGWYWCTDMHYSNTSNAYSLGFSSDKPNLYDIIRYSGQSIRGIQ